MPVQFNTYRHRVMNKWNALQKRHLLLVFLFWSPLNPLWISVMPANGTFGALRNEYFYSPDPLPVVRRKV